MPRVQVLIPLQRIDVDKLPLNRKSWEMSLLLEGGIMFKPVKLTRLKNGRYLLRDGRHRFVAHKLVGRQDILAKIAKEAV